MFINMSSNIIFLNKELASREKSRKLTPKQKLSVEIHHNIVTLIKLKRIYNYHFDKCNEHASKCKEAWDAYDAFIDEVKQKNRFLCAKNKIEDSIENS